MQQKWKCHGWCFDFEADFQWFEYKLFGELVSLLTAFGHKTVQNRRQRVLANVLATEQNPTKTCTLIGFVHLISDRSIKANIKLIQRNLLWFWLKGVLKISSELWIHTKTIVFTLFYCKTFWWSSHLSPAQIDLELKFNQLFSSYSVCKIIKSESSVLFPH